jgi:gliding motility-associated-like protein
MTLIIKHIRKALLFLSVLCTFPTWGQSYPCPAESTEGTDFWVTFIPNGNTNTPSLSVIATGPNNATISIVNPQTGWSTTVSHTGGDKTSITLPSTSISNIPSATASSIGFHVTSTANISLYASNYIADSWDLCCVLPTSRLTSEYIVQDFPNNSNYNGGLCLVATEDSTVLTMVIPCPVDNLSLPVGSTYTVTLNEGQTLALYCGANQGFCGMTITSNGKPFALFQGHTCARVGTTDTQRGRDHIVEQSIPLAWWGSEFVVLAEQDRTEGDWVRITASTNSTQVQIVEASGNVNVTLNAGQTHEYHLPAYSVAHITSSGPVYVCKYLASYDKTNTSLGDPASVDIPPLHNWLCNTTFPVHNYNTNTYSEHYISAGHHYLDIVTTSPTSMTLDGVALPASSFTALSGTPYYYRQTSIATGAHTLACSDGVFYATVSGHSKWVGYAFLTGMGLDAEEPQPEPEQSSCPGFTTQGRDFWLAYILNGGDQRPQYVYLIAVSDSLCTLTVTNPASGWTQNATISPHSDITITLPNDDAIPEHYSQGETKGFHITATSNVQVTALFTQLASSGVATLLPSAALDTRYVVLDYPADPGRPTVTGASVTILATEPNTTVNYTPPCTLYTLAGDPAAPAADSTATHTFSQAGQTLTLMANSASASLSGMEITADKPIAVFQGNQITGVPYTTPSGDMMYDQALPTGQWGTEYALVPTLGRTVGDRVRVVADEACTVTLSTGNTFSLATKGVHEFDLPANAPCILTATQPVSVGLCMKGSDYGAQPGDASLVMIPPTSRGVCHSLFSTYTTQRINSWYVTLVTDQPGTMTLDGTSVASQFNPIGSTGYSYARISVSAGPHSVDNSDGTFTGWSYGKGNVESYAFPLAYALDTTSVPMPEPEPEPEPEPVPQIHRDTVNYLDTVCQGQPYNGYGFSITADSTASHPLPAISLIDSTIVDDTIIHYRTLTLTLLPTASSEDNMTIIPGDTLLYLDSTITLAGDYRFTLTAANGCDSIVTLHVGYQAAGLTASADGICPGDEVVLTAEGTHTFLWSASPHDPELDTQQGQNPITVHPRVTTTYSLLDAAGNTIASHTVGTAPPPTLCVEIGRPFLDFDIRVITLHDCSEDRHHTRWEFSDGVTLSGERTRRLMQHPLPDSLSVTMVSCNKYDCCADTTLGFPLKIRSVWFPNIFTPDADNNNRFGCVTSMEVAEYEIIIFNRWGFEVWRSTDIQTLWDGTHDGTPMPQGAYVYRWYLIDRYGERNSGIGTVTLVR